MDAHADGTLGTRGSYCRKPRRSAFGAVEGCRNHRFFSQARNGTKIAVDYTTRENVKKPSGAKTGFVTYVNFSTLLVNPDEHAELLKQ